MFHGLKDDTNLHTVAGQYGSALGELHSLAGAAEQHAALDGASERLRLARAAVPAAQEAYERAIADEKSARIGLRTLLYGVIELIWRADPELAELMPNIDVYEQNDVYFACDRVADVLGADRKYAFVANAVRAAKADRLRKVDLVAAKSEIRARAHTTYKAARATIQKVIKEAYIFITENAPRTSRAHDMIKRKVKPRAADSSVAAAQPPAMPVLAAPVADTRIALLVTPVPASVVAPVPAPTPPPGAAPGAGAMAPLVSPAAPVVGPAIPPIVTPTDAPGSALLIAPVAGPG